jgi:hypothetical protein
MVRPATVDGDVGGQDPARCLPEVNGMPYTKSNLQVEHCASRGKMRKPGMSDRQVAIEFAIGCRELGTTAARTGRLGVAGIGVSR